MKRAAARIVVVLGMHRSGTSLITRSLQVLGVSLGDRLMPPADGNNAKGFFEDIDINALNIRLMAELGSDWHAIEPIGQAGFDQLERGGRVKEALEMIRAKAGDGQVFGFKDPRTAQLLPFWQAVFRAGGFEVTYLLALRNPASVADSLASRDQMPRERSYYLWLEHMLNSLAGAMDSAPVLVDYDDFFGDADGVLDRMAAVLGLPVDATDRERFKNEFIDDALRHAVHGADDLSTDPACPPLVVELYRALKEAARERVIVDTPQWRASIAAWQAELERIRPALRLADARPAAPVQAAPEAGALEVLKTVARHAPALLSNVLDRKWYHQAYPDIAEAGLDPWRHYSETGVYEGRHPGPDVVRSAQRALDELVGTREAAEQREVYLEQARRDEQRWADLKELQRAAGDRERSLDEELRRAQGALERALESRAEREAAAVAREREAAQAADAAAQRQLAELDKLRQAHAAREAALAEQAQQARVEVRRLLEQAAEREAASAAAAAVLQREHAERMVALTQRSDQRHEDDQRQVQAVRDHVEALLRQLADQESKAQQRDAALQAEHAAAIVRLQQEQQDLAARMQREREADVARLLGERERAEADWGARLAQALAEGDAARARAEREHAALAQDLERLTQDRDRLAQDLEHLTQDRDRLAQDLEHLTQDRDRLKQDRDRLKQEGDRLTQALADSEAAGVRAGQDRAALAKEFDTVRAELDAIRGSFAWRAVAPFARRRA